MAGFTVFPEPGSSTDPVELFVRYFAFYRETVEGKLRGLSQEQLTTSLLPSGWTPLEMLTHLVFMERRWFVWGVLGEDVPEPWGDRGLPAGSDRDGTAADGPDGPDGGDAQAVRWRVREGDTLDSLLERLHAGGRRTAEILGRVDLSDPAAPGGRFGDEPPPSVLWICFHVLQEYARHAGHLDVVRELTDGATGEA